MNYLNLGCGGRYHNEWINIDIIKSGSDVIVCDLSHGIPLPDTSCDVVYHSHLLEHIRRENALLLMKECYRVMKPGGVLRVAVPDLEQICRLYLGKLEAASNGDVAAKHDYEWIMLEMYDQTVRESSGGGMLTYLSQDPLPNEEFVYKRIGETGRNLVRASKCLQERLTEQLRRNRFKKIRSFICSFPKIIRNRFRMFLLGRDGMKALNIGQFRLSGEAHQWMYDRYSLAQLMSLAGFRNPIVQSAAISQIPDWLGFNLDTLADGTVIKPDSLFMEAIKPNV